MVAKLRKGFRSDKTRDKDYRIKQLRNLFRMLEEQEDKILKAVYNDLKKVCIYDSHLALSYVHIRTHSTCIYQK